MDEPIKSNPAEETAKQDEATISDAKMQAELKELIELNEIQAGALKKIMSKLDESVKKEDPSIKS